MKITSHRKFNKQYDKLPKKIKQQFRVRLEIYLDDPASPLLKVHTLSVDKYPLQSMNVTADYRALFIKESDKVTFYEIGTHSQLYD